MTNVAGFSSKSKGNIKYPNLTSAIRPVPHCADLPPPLFTSLPEVGAEPVSSTSEESSLEDDCYVPLPDTKSSILVTQAFLNDLVRDLNLPKDSAELLGSRLQHNNLFAPNTTYSWYRRREKDLVQYFSMEETFGHCHNVTGLPQAMGCIYDPEEWRLFIDSCKASLKCVLLHNGNRYASISISHSVHLKETHTNMKMVLTKTKYDEHKWMVCGDLKVLSMLLGQQGGYTKYPCFLCLWNSRAKDEHWIREQWPKRNEFTVGEKNILNESLVPPDKVILPPLYIKLGLMKQYVKSLDKGGECFKYICQKFSFLSHEKIKAGVFDGPKIRQLMKDK